MALSFPAIIPPLLYDVKGEYRGKLPGDLSPDLSGDNLPKSDVFCLIWDRVPNPTIFIRIRGIKNPAFLRGFSVTYTLPVGCIPKFLEFRPRISLGLRLAERPALSRLWQAIRLLPHRLLRFAAF